MILYLVCLGNLFEFFENMTFFFLGKMERTQKGDYIEHVYKLLVPITVKNPKCQVTFGMVQTNSTFAL